MRVFEYSVLLLEADSSIDGLWNMFLTLHAAAFATIFLLGRTNIKSTILVRISGIILYLCFMFINGRAMIDSYFLIDIIDRAATRAIVESGENFSEIQRYLEHVDYSKRWQMVYFVHGIAGIIVIVAMMLSGQRAPLSGKAKKS